MTPQEKDQKEKEVLMEMAHTMHDQLLAELRDMDFSRPRTKAYKLLDDILEEANNDPEILRGQHSVALKTVVLYARFGHVTAMLSRVQKELDDA